MTCPKDKIEEIGPFRRIILCAECLKNKAKETLQDMAQKVRGMKQRIPNPDLNPTVDTETIFTSSQLPTIQQWGETQENLSTSLGLTLKAKDMVTYNLSCRECGKPVRPTQRKPKVPLCELHYRAYQLNRAARKQRTYRERLSK